MLRSVLIHSTNIYGPILVYWSAQATITKCHRFGGLNSRHLLSHSSEGWAVQTQGAGWLSFWWEFSSWFVATFLLCPQKPSLSECTLEGVVRDQWGEERREGRGGEKKKEGASEQESALVSYTLLIGTLIPWIRDLPLWPHLTITSTGTLSLNTVTLRGLPQMNLGKTHIQSIA